MPAEKTGKITSETRAIQIQALKEAIAYHGSQSNLAKAIGKSQGHVASWLDRYQIDPYMIIKIEESVKRTISRHELNQQIYPRDDACIEIQTAA